MTEIINGAKTAAATAAIRAYDHKTRQRILKEIDTAGKVKVTDIYKSLCLEQATTSLHLKILRDAKLVEAERNGKCIYYSLNYRNMEKINTAVRTLYSMHNIV